MVRIWCKIAEQLSKVRQKVNEYEERYQKKVKKQEVENNNTEKRLLNDEPIDLEIAPVE